MFVFVVFPVLWLCNLFIFVVASLVVCWIGFFCGCLLRVWFSSKFSLAGGSWYRLCLFVFVCGVFVLMFSVCLLVGVSISVFVYFFVDVLVRHACVLCILRFFLSFYILFGGSRVFFLLLSLCVLCCF